MIIARRLALILLILAIDGCRVAERASVIGAPASQPVISAPRPALVQVERPGRIELDVGGVWNLALATLLGCVIGYLLCWRIEKWLARSRAVTKQPNSG